MTARTTLLLLLAAAGCAGGRPISRAPPPDQPPLPRSSIVAVLAHRSDLDLTDDQVAALEQADAELQQRLIRLRAEGGLLPAPAAGGGPGPGGGAPPSGGRGGPSGGVPGGGFGMNMGPGGFQMTPSPGGLGDGSHGGGGHGLAGPHAEGPHAGPPRRDPAKAQEALEERLDDADTAAFLKAEPVLSAAQRERAREIATSYREQLFERREALRGR
jgi:hypothetical protein